MAAAHTTTYPRTRQDALKLGVPKYYTGKPCKQGHLSPRRTASKQCIACAQSLSVSTAIKDGRYIQPKSIASIQRNVAAVRQRNDLELELELARIEKHHRDYD